MSLSSIHIQKANSNCFKHNSREEKHPAQTINNEYSNNNICSTNSQDAQDEFNKIYNERIAQATSNRTAKKENCLVEAVANIEPGTTEKQLKELSDYIEKEFKFKIIQTAIHKDEGHKKDDRLEINYHAHLVFATLDENGKQMYRREHIDREKLSILQDKTASILEMERGKENSTSKRLSHQDFKEHKKRTEPLEQKINMLENKQEVILELAIKNDKNNNQEIENTKQQLKEVKNDLKKQKEHNLELRAEAKENEENREYYARLEQNNRNIKEELENTKEELKQSLKMQELEKREKERSWSKLQKYEKSLDNKKDRGMEK